MEKERMPKYESKDMAEVQKEKDRKDVAEIARRAIFNEFIYSVRRGLAPIQLDILEAEAKKQVDDAFVSEVLPTIKAIREIVDKEILAEMDKKLPSEISGVFKYGIKEAKKMAEEEVVRKVFYDRAINFGKKYEEIEKKVAEEKQLEGLEAYYEARKHYEKIFPSEEALFFYDEIRTKLSNREIRQKQEEDRKRQEQEKK